MTEEEMVRFKFYTPDRNKHPGNTTRSLEVTYRSVKVLLTWDINDTDSLARLADSMPAVMAQVERMEESTARAHEEAKNLDRELEEFFGGDSEEEK
jgi:hypothetical protein